MTRAALVERTARILAAKKHGKEHFWTTCISEVSQQITLAMLQAKRAA